MKKKIKNFFKLLLCSIFAKKINYNKVKKYTYISFDVFDTLIKRNVFNETDIFDIVELKYNFGKNNNQIKNFKYDRILAEKKAREKSNNEEILLSDIYDELQYDSIVKNELKEIEIATEIEYCVCNPEVKEIYSKCKLDNKRIIIASDMYLDESIVKRILLKNGYEYDYFYLSSKELKRKRNYSLYKCIISELKINKKEIIHIGDNILSDFLVPKLHGMNAFLVKNKKITARTENKLFDGIINSTSNNMISCKMNFFEKLGGTILGPLLVGFSKYIYKQVSDKKIEKLFFLARDAKIIMQAYEKIYDAKNCHYLNVSRKSVIKASLSNCNSLIQFKSIINPLMRRNASIYDVLYNLGIKISNYEKELIKLNININDKFYHLSIDSQNIIFALIKKEVIQIGKEQNKLLCQYLIQESFSGKIAIVDIGWRGTIQRLLYECCKNNNIDAEITGIYYGIRNSTNDDVCGYIYEGESKPEFYEINYSVGFFETLFLSDEGSTIGYYEKDQIVYPLLNYKEHNVEEEKNIVLMRKTALNYIDRLKNSINILPVEYKFYYNNYKKFAVNPSYYFIKKISKMTFLDDKKISLIYYRGLVVYLTHPALFKNDLENTHYKIGFLKLFFKIRMNYTSLLKLLKKFDRKE